MNILSQMRSPNGVWNLLWTIDNPGISLFEQLPTPPSSMKPGWLFLPKGQGCESPRCFPGHNFLITEVVSGHGTPSKLEEEGTDDLQASTKALG